MTETRQMVFRTWKRDGSQDVMELDAAVENLVQNGARVSGSEPERREAFRHALLAGETLETRNATFEIGPLHTRKP